MTYNEERGKKLTAGSKWQAQQTQIRKKNPKLNTEYLHLLLV